ncbi:MAG: adenylate/guanylate cyclase domain-containing protein [Myxococcaceae bacterium]
MATVQASETVARLQVERRRDDEQVKAESALIGEQFLSVIRLFMFVMFGVSVILPALTGDFTPVFDLARVLVASAYALFCLITLFAVRRVKSAVGRALVVPMIMITIDYAFIVFMGWRRAVVDHLAFPETTVITCAVLVAFCVARFSRVHVWYSALLSIASYVFITAYTQRFSLHSVGFVIGGFISLALMMHWANQRLARMFLDIRRRENLARFLPRQIAERVLKHENLLEPTQREVTVLFTDIRDFTSLSEKMPPREVLAFLDRYFGHMSQIVKGHDGVVNKFLGDGMLAVWGVPDRDEQHAEKALKAALDMRKKLIEFNQERVNEGLPPIRMGMGIHTGPVAAGMLGGADQHEYTVIGDAVNLASRIEGLTKALHVDLLVSESTWAQLGERFRGARAGEETVKGRLQPVTVYTIEGQSPSVAA